jgi:hypothetical protein
MWSQVFGVATFCSTKVTKQTGNFSDSPSLLLSQIKAAEKTFVEDVDGDAAPPTSDVEAAQR